MRVVIKKSIHQDQAEEYVFRAVELLFGSGSRRITTSQISNCLSGGMIKVGGEGYVPLEATTLEINGILWVLDAKKKLALIDCSSDEYVVECRR